MAAAEQRADTDKPKGRFGGRQGTVKVKDKQTGEFYGSKSKAGKAVAAEFGLDPDNNFVWYQIVKQAPERFEEIR